MLFFCLCVDNAIAYVCCLAYVDTSHMSRMITYGYGDLRVLDWYGGHGLMWVDPPKLIFEFARGNFEKFRISHF